MALHPFVVDMMARAEASGRPALSDGSPTHARALVASTRGALGPGPAVGKVEEVALPGRSGPVAARLYSAAPINGSDHADGLIVYVHGGGWVCGTLDDFDALARTLAVRTGCIVLSVDYRLAPEHRFPCGLEDVEDALLWAEAARQTAFDAELPLVVAGDSAGGNLATVAIANLRRTVRPMLQCLFYPVTDSDTQRPSYLEHGTNLPLTRQDMLWFLQHYAEPSHWTDPRIAPLRNADLTGCAPAWIVVAEYDVLHDEGLAYAQALSRAGVHVEVVQLPSLAHGFLRLFNLLPEADAVVQAAALRIREAVAHANDARPGLSMRSSVPRQAAPMQTLSTELHHSHVQRPPETSS